MFTLFFFFFSLSNMRIIRIAVTYKQRNVLVPFLGEPTVELIKAKVLAKLQLEKELFFFVIFNGLEVEFDSDCVDMLMDTQDWRIVVKEEEPVVEEAPTPDLTLDHCEVGLMLTSTPALQTGTTNTPGSVPSSPQYRSGVYVSQASVIGTGSPSSVGGACGGLSTMSPGQRSSGDATPEWPHAVPRYAIRQDVLTQLDNGSTSEKEKKVKIINEAWYLHASKREGYENKL